MILQAHQIADRLESDTEVGGALVITPEPDIEALRSSGAASVDLRLGTWFVRAWHTRLACLNVAEESNESADLVTETQYVPFGRDFILHPGRFVLGITLEWIRLPSDLAGYVIGRSSWGRRGLIIATAIGVHPRFTGCLTLELINFGEIPISIKPGMSICQLFLQQAGIGSDNVDRTAFRGQRKPVLGTIEMDDFAKALSKQGGLPQ